VAVDTPLGRLGLTTCYDLRFPEMYQALTWELGAQLLLVPSAFTQVTGGQHRGREGRLDSGPPMEACCCMLHCWHILAQLLATMRTPESDAMCAIPLHPAVPLPPRPGAAHWEVLLRARAIECQAYVIAAAQAGRHNHKRASYGHALVVDPWGSIVGRLEDPGATGLALVDIDLEALAAVRAKMPIQQHRAAGRARWAAGRS
jgi:predicted amidohydrolase